MTDADLKSSPGRDEADLVWRAKRLDRTAWAEIYSAHERFIYRYVRARVFEEAVAEDLTSAVFLAALQSIGSYRDRGRPLLAWLYRLARNTVADHQRKLVGPRGMREWLSWGRPSQDGEQVQEPREAATSAGDPAEGIERLDLRQAIALLPERQREVVILRHFVGLSTPEIAAAIGKQPAAVYSLEARALASLRATLTDFDELSGRTDENGSRHAINRQMESVDR